MAPPATAEPISTAPAAPTNAAPMATVGCLLGLGRALEDSRDLVLAVWSPVPAGVSASALPAMVATHGPDSHKAYETSYQAAYAAHPDLTRRDIAELRKPRIRLAPVVGILGAAGIGMVAGRVLP